ncbi:alkaline phosphatase [Saccharicrinis fermentans]|uniref:Alkaline phosphatase 4 n=1 Tax=Saccharicrinis fermentans DSM 9555 = JCM 21142 TaxID=869213 RepID=W7Y1T3_9BACT|nr:alkaline phosphatase [Saccharicrinis fermentans]GAF01907.1 alkaline phosphatase 4 precursor [Saccharicrinis fermentans DSM 9555 = JCM 21142]
MKRRDFLNTGVFAALGGALATTGCTPVVDAKKEPFKGKAKNIIFLVSDGMSVGTPTMADLLLQRKEGRSSQWMDLYRQNKVRHALMDTASADSLVTDSAAASSSWGGGVRVKNGSLNVGKNGENHKPILQKFKAAGKAVGCVTTVPITHATPAGFSVNMKHRNMQDKIADKYLELGFDVMMGGGLEYFNGTKRDDKKNILGDFKDKGFNVVQTKSQMTALQAGKPTLGVFTEGGLPYSVDQHSDEELQNKIPSLADMTSKAIALMQNNSNGFVLQVEGGRVDWAAHGNDAGALLYDQLAFDQAVEVAIKFAENRNDTLVIITTDHGNSNPGLIKSTKVDQKFDLLQSFKHSNEWVLHNIKKTDSPANVVERINYAHGYTISEEEAKTILKAYSKFDNGGLYNSYKLPFKQLAEIQENYISIFWSGMNHSADFVELAMYGVETEALPPLVKNTDLHNYMLQAAGVRV